MKNTTYWFGDLKCNAYMKKYGQGYEVGFHFGKTQIFVGNFIHKSEATKWWSHMSKELKSFTTKFVATEDVSYTWYSKFFSNHLYSAYYTFLDKHFAKYNKSFAKAFTTDARKYKHMKASWDGDVVQFKKVG